MIFWVFVRRISKELIGIVAEILRNFSRKHFCRNFLDILIKFEENLGVTFWVFVIRISKELIGTVDVIEKFFEISENHFLPKFFRYFEYFDQI